jgi:hypothetical protein
VPGACLSLVLSIPEDLLTRRLSSLDDDDLKSLLVGALRVSESRVEGLLHCELVEFCDNEFRTAAGFTSVNLARRFRRQSLPYKRLLIDVADKLTPGVTPLSWTSYRLKDDHDEEEIEDFILECFEERVRKWWVKLPENKRQEFVGGLNSVLSGAHEGTQAVKQRAAPLLQQQAVENLIQSGLITGLSKVSAGGLLGIAGVSVIGQIGWLILVQTVGWMAGLKIAIFGIGGYGAFGGAVTFVGATAVGTVVALPGFLFLADGPAYRKTVPGVVMLLAKTKLNQVTEAIVEEEQ